MKLVKCNEVHIKIGQNAKENWHLIKVFKNLLALMKIKKSQALFMWEQKLAKKNKYQHWILMNLQLTYSLFDL